MAFKLRRGLNSDRLTITPLEGEVIYATDTKLVYIGDGVTVGGIPVADNFTGNTSLVPEGANLYFTNSRVVSALTAGNGISINANGLITGSSAFTGNTNVVPEGTANLYFTNARVVSALTAGNGISINANGLITSTANILGSSVIQQTLVGGDSNYTLDAVPLDVNRMFVVVNGLIQLPIIDYNISGANLTFTGNTISNATIDVRIVGISDGEYSNFNGDTSSVPEGTNLYFTNARSISALTSGQNISIAANGLITGVSPAFAGNTGSVPEVSSNLYYTNARVYSNVIGLINVKANTADLNTSNVVEGNNLYFTNTRAISAFTAGQNLNISAGGVITTTINQIIEGNLTVNGNVLIMGNVAKIDVANFSVTDNMIYLNSNSLIANPDIGIAANYNDGTYHHTGMFRDATDGRWKFFENYSPEPDASAFIDTAHATFRLANVQANVFFGSGLGLTDIPATSITGNTNSISEGSVNLYYTNARVISALVAESNITIGSTNGAIININGTARLSANNANYLQIVGGVSNAAVTLSAQGTSQNTDITFTPKGTGRVNITTSIKPKVNSAVSVTSPLAWDSTSFDVYAISALANALTINADANTSPADGQKMMFRFEDDGTPRALTWTTGSTNAFRAIGITLPTTTVALKMMYVGCIYNATDSRWDAIAVSQEA
jgi:hypothetical protein